MKTDFLPFLKSSLQAYSEEIGIDLLSRSPIQENLGHKVLIVSPHPDDETINGALALRLKQNYNCEIFNFPFGFGSNLSRQNERKAELIEATKILGFTNIFEQNLEHTISTLKPQLIILPHADDGHIFHTKTYVTVMATLKKLLWTGNVALTEFWYPNRSANLLLEVAVEECALLMESLSAHFGEIKRNPYHLRLPFWMMDNSRRGSELILGTKIETASLLLSNLYQIKFYKDGNEYSSKYEKQKKLITLQENLSAFFCD